MTTQFRPPTQPTESGLLADISFPSTTFTLENGLTVIVAENHNAALVSLRLTYLVGSKDEPAGKTGFAHLFEHLMFEGSAHAPGSFLEKMMDAGATNLNAFTGADYTIYHATVPTGSLDYALFLESDRMGHFCDTISQQSLEQQRRVVLNEKLETEGGPYGKLYECKSRGCFPAAHPYAHTVIGEKDDLVAATLDDVKQWFRTYYTPSNAVLTLCGDIDVTRAREKVMHWFGDIPPGPPLYRPSSWIAAVPPRRRDLYQARVTHGSIMLVWNIPPDGDGETTLLTLVADYMASGISSLLVRQLVYRDKLASLVSAQVSEGELCSQFILFATVADGVSLMALETRLLKEVQEFLTLGCDDQRLQKVKNDVLNTFRDNHKTSARIAALLSRSLLTLGDASAFHSLLLRCGQASSAEIQQVARRWLSREHYTLEIRPFSGRADDSAVAADRSSPPEIPLPVTQIFPPMQHAQLENGLRVILLERHSRPDIVLDLLIPGVGLPRAGQHQLLIDLLNQSGTTEKDAFTFNQACCDIGCHMEFRRQLHHLSLLLSCRSEHLPAALELLQERLRYSVFLEDDFRRQRARLLDTLAEQQNIVAAQAMRVLPALMYPAGHPCRVACGIEGTVSALSQTTLAELTAALPELLNLAGATLVITGDTTLGQLLPLLNAALGHLPVHERSADTVPGAAVPPYPRLFLLDIPGAEQTSIVAASLLPGIHKGQEAAFELLNTLFASGFTSRINLNLRESKNWTYGVNAGLINDPEQRVHYLQTDVQADRTCAAVGEILKEYQALNHERPVTAHELEQVRRTSLFSFSSTLESLASLNSMISWQVRNRLADDFWLQHQQQLRETGVGQVIALAQRLFTVDRLTWVIAGDMQRYQQELAGLLPVERHIIMDHGDSLYD